jgi:hypothetical protein
VTVTTIWSKLSLGLLATISFEAVPIRAYVTFPNSFTILKCTLEVVFCESVQHSLRFCLNHFNYVKMAALQFYPQSKKQRKVWWVEDDSHFFFRFRNPLVKNKCEIVRCREATPSSIVAKVQGEFSHSIRKKVRLVWGIDWLAWFFMNYPLFKKNYEHAVDLALNLSPLFRSRWLWTFRLRLMLPSPKACLIISRVFVALLSRFAQNLTLFLCRIQSEIAPGQINDPK